MDACAGEAQSFFCVLHVARAPIGPSVIQQGQILTCHILSRQIGQFMQLTDSGSRDLFNVVSRAIMRNIAASFALQSILHLSPPLLDAPLPNISYKQRKQCTT
ncbi:hypothetical protein ANO14919_046030 [Xylariales sp. No.14919]|nr:hypothetical protein ANO14919_046030 [Xylariales sp. No.14919]